MGNPGDLVRRPPRRTPRPEFDRIAQRAKGPSFSGLPLSCPESTARRRGEKDDYEDAIIGVTEDIQQATRVRIPSIVAGQLPLRSAEIMFSDLCIFNHRDLNAKPVLLIGMDVLGVRETLVTDFRRSELQIRIRRRSIASRFRAAAT